MNSEPGFEVTGGRDCHVLGDNHIHFSICVDNSCVVHGDCILTLNTRTLKLEAECFLERLVSTYKTTWCENLLNSPMKLSAVEYLTVCSMPFSLS
jgi:hypothetical protein